MKPFALYPVDKLPSGFRYPDELIYIAETGDCPDLSPWWFVDASSKAGALFYATRQSDGRNLIPFAKVDDFRDDIACFDGDDTNGNPVVLMLTPDESPESSYSFASFRDWLAAAKVDAEKFRQI